MRCTWLAKLETISRWVARAKTSSRTGPMLRSGVTNPGTSAFVESDSSRSMPLDAEPRERPEVGEHAVEGQLVHLEVAGVHEQAGRACARRPRARRGSSG